MCACRFDGTAVLAAILALCGGAIAIWSLRVRRLFTTPAILGWASLFVIFVATVWVVA